MFCSTGCISPCAGAAVMPIATAANTTQPTPFTLPKLPALPIAAKARTPIKPSLAPAN